MKDAFIEFLKEFLDKFHLEELYVNSSTSALKYCVSSQITSSWNGLQYNVWLKGNKSLTILCQNSTIYRNAKDEPHASTYRKPDS